MSKPNILVVGSINMDLMIYGVPKIPKYGETVFCDNYSYVPGGKGANQALAVALQGANSTMVGRVGNDENGHIIKQELENSGVNTDYIIVDKKTQTGLDPILVNNTGKYVSYVVLGGNNCLQPVDVENALKDNEYDMLIMQLEMPLEMVYKTYELATKRNIPVFLDAGPAMTISFERLKGIYIISPNEAETEALTGITIDTEKRARKAARLLYEEIQAVYVILKMGSRGVLLYDGKEAKMIPAFKINAIDSTGAGDTFGATLAVQLCKGVGINKAIVISQAAAGICVSRKGAQPSIPSEKEVNDYLQKHNTDFERSLL
ncbi:MAG: ribokinase [Firmicutes bacterium]|nr:ribokinase [Bacillota bacterium]